MIYIVGDIHGEITKLRKLVDFIQGHDRNPSYVFIGDYLDKGEDACRTLNYLSDFNKTRECTFLIGNHEYIWLNLNEGDEDSENWLLSYGGRKTIKSLGVDTPAAAKEKLLDRFSDFFDLLRPYWSNGDYIAVHSGIPSEYYETPADKIPVEKLLFNRYDFIKENKLYLGRYKVIFGHTGFYFPYVDRVKIGVDTAACFLNKQPLTAFCPEKEMFFGSDNRTFGVDSVTTNHCPNIVRLPTGRNYAYD